MYYIAELVIVAIPLEFRQASDVQLAIITIPVASYNILSIVI